MEIKSLPTVAGTMEGGPRIGRSSLRTIQSSVCVYINIQLLLNEKENERTEWRETENIRSREKGQEQGEVDITENKCKVHKERG